MTEQVLCETKPKGYFKSYLLYRIKEQKANLILCIVLNLFTLPLFFAGQIKGFDDRYSPFYYFGTYFSLICGIFLIVLAVIGAVFSFEFFHRKNLTDTIGSLPLTFKQRFWGDFLAGYIANVAAVIPVGVITAAVMGADSSFEYIDYTRTTFQFFLCIASSLFFTLTFVYLFAVLVTSACGKVLHSVLFSIFGTAAICGTVAGFGGCFAVGAVGTDVVGYMIGAAACVPPLGTVIDLIRSIRFFTWSDTFDFIDGGQYLTGIDDTSEKFFTSADALHTVWFVIFGAVIIFCAYYVGKRRKTEKTGSAFAVKPMFYVLSAFFSAAAVFIVTVMNIGKYIFGNALLIAMGVGGIMCFVSIVMYLPKKKSLPQCILCGMLAVGVSAGAAALLKGTGSFGAAYLPENANEIEYIRIDGCYTVTDKADIKIFVKNHNDILRKNKDKLVFTEWFGYTVEYKTTDGRVIKRSYDSIANSKPVKKYFENTEKTLPSYGRLFFDMVNERSSLGQDSCHIVEGNLEYDITEQNYDEFFETLKREAAEKYDPDAEVYAKAEFWTYNDQGTFNIGKNFEDTIALLDRIKSKAEPDPNELILTVDYSPENGGSLRVNIRNRDMDDPLAKELIGLLKKDTEGGSDWDGDFTVIYTDSFSSGNRWAYYVPQESSKRVLEIMTELAIRELEA